MTCQRLAILVSVSLPLSCVLADKGDPAAAPAVRSSEEQKLATIAAKVTEAYGKLERYSFEASLHRQWTEKGKTIERQNHAVVKMGIDTILTRVFDSAGSDKHLVAVIVKKKGEDSRLPVDRREDGCLSGQLENPWIGPTPTRHVLYLAKRIEAGRYAGTEQVNGRTCHVIKHDLVEREDEYYYRRVDTYYVDAKTFRIAVWKNEDYEKPTGKPWMTCTRSYTERAVRERVATTEGE